MAEFVTILLPVFNAAATLDACLRSVQRQSLRDWRLLLIDDGSSDASAQIAAAAARSDPRIHFLSEPHRGLIETLCIGLNLVQTPYVARMDADDLMHRDRLKRQRAELIADPTLDLVGSHVRLFPRDDLTDGRRAYEEWLSTIRTPADVKRDLFVECPLVHPTWLARTATLKRIGYRDRGWPEDYDLLLRLILSGGRAGVVPQRLLSWRNGAQRLSSTSDRYAIPRFTDCRADALASSFLQSSEGYNLWGYGHTGRQLRKALATHGKTMRGLIELHPGRIGQRIHGAEVVLPEQIDRLSKLPLIVSVAGLSVRQRIRQQLTEMGLRDGSEFVCAA